MTAGRPRWRWWCVAVWAATVTATAAVSVGRSASLPVSSAGLTVVATCELSGYPGTTTLVADATVRQDRSTTNYGTSASLGVRSSAGANRRAYLRYDLTQCAPAIPPSASVKSATLKLRVTGTGLPVACRTEDVLRVTAAWTESTITWDNQPPSSPTPTSSVDVGVLLACTYHTALSYVGWNVTADVQSFVAGTVTNNGWVIRDRTEGSAVAQIAAFSSKNSGASASAPLLTVTYMT